MAPKYEELITTVFKSKWKPGDREVPFTKADVEQVNAQAGLEVKNLPDAIYSYRYRKEMPASIASLAPNDTKWTILPTGTATYKFALARDTNIDPNPHLAAIKIPDATPEVIRMYSLGDEQAALARVRYNRLVDLFLGLNAYSLQNHLRTQVRDIGQMEIDELYVGVGSKGTHFVIPVQAKGGADRVGIVQLMQDLQFCKERFPELVPRALAVYSMNDEEVAMMDLTIETDSDGVLEVKIRSEQHYRLVGQQDLSATELETYRLALGL